MSLANTFRAHTAVATAAEHRILRTLLTDYPRAGLETMARLAKRADTSSPTVLRLVQKLGFAGYPEFQERLREEIAAREASPLDLYARTSVSADPVRQRAEDTLVQIVRESSAALPTERFDVAVGMICRARQRVTIGGRYTSMIASYLSTHLQQLMPNSRHVSSGAMERTSALLDVDRRTAIVAYDFRRYQEDTVRFCRLAKRQGAKLILFTDPWLSPAAGSADVVFPCRVESASPFDSSTATLAMSEILIAGVVEALGDAPLERIATFEEFQLDEPPAG